jgi:peptidoglycan/LPS O-acetylase OafA/YrhL
MSSALQQREFDIDFFRGIVCLSLMCLHFYIGSLYDAFMRLFGDMGEYIVWHIRLGVESFFILAGFMMAHMLRPTPGEAISTGRYLKRRFYRLIVPYWTAILIFVGYRWLARLVLHADNAPSLVEVLAQMFLLQEFLVEHSRQLISVPIGYWSMVTLEQFYLIWIALYAISLRVFGRNSAKGFGRAERAMAFLTFAVALLSLALWQPCCANVRQLGLYWQMSPSGNAIFIADAPVYVQLPFFAVFMAVGMLLYWAIRQKLLRGYFIVAVAALLLSAITTNDSRLWRALITSCLFVPLAHGARLPNNMLLRFLRYCGQRSYSLYLIHGIVGVAFISLTWRLTLKSDWFVLPITFVALVLSILASIVFYRYVELPCQVKSRSVAYRGKTGATTSSSADVVKPATPVVVS